MAFQIQKIPDEQYFKIGSLNKDDFVLSASLGKEVFKYGLYPVLKGEQTFGDEPSEYMKLGSALHCFTLENDQFNSRYYVSDDVNTEDKRERLTSDNIDLIKSMFEKIQKFYPFDVDGNYTEIAMTGVLNGIPSKCKFDKLNVRKDGSGFFTDVEVVDVKKIWYDPYSLYRHVDGERKGLKSKIRELGYDLQAYLYTEMVKSWLYETGHSGCNVSFTFLLCSLETGKLMRVRAGDEFMESGRLKYESVTSEVSEYIQSGFVSMTETI